MCFFFIVDLFCENEFLDAKSEMEEVLFEQNLSMI